MMSCCDQHLSLADVEIMEETVNNILDDGGWWLTLMPLLPPVAAIEVIVERIEAEEP